MTDNEISNKVADRMLELWKDKYLNENIVQGKDVLNAMVKISEFVAKEFHNSLASMEALILMGQTVEHLCDEIKREGPHRMM